jgi:hypothetical protein
LTTIYINISITIVDIVINIIIIINNNIFSSSIIITAATSSTSALHQSTLPASSS